MWLIKRLVIFGLEAKKRCKEIQTNTLLRHLLQVRPLHRLQALEAWLYLAREKLQNSVT